MRPMLLALLSLAPLVPLPASAWQFTPLPICTLTQQEPGLTTQITFDPASGIYALHLDRAGGWAAADLFVMEFSGGMARRIATDRHVIDGNRLTVTDRGFGNVLAGLARNTAATAILGDLAVPIDLTGAAPAVEEFTACPAAPIA